MTLLQAAAVITLWKSGRFDTFDIAKVMGFPESSVVKLLDAARERERGPDLRIVGGAAP